MRLLDRYLAKELLVPLGYCLGGFLIFWTSAEMVSYLDTLQADGLGFLEIVLYYLLKMPESLMVVMPVALLLALLYAVTNHARHHELTAMRAAGRSLWRICVPYLGIGLGCSLAVALLNEGLLPDGAVRAEQLRYRGEGVEAGGRAWQKDLRFWNDRERRFWWIRAYHRETGEMQEPYVEWTLPDGSRGQLHAQRAIWTNGIWRFHDARLLVPESASAPLPLQRREPVLPMPEFSETPDDIRSQIKISQLSSVRAARRVRLTLGEIFSYRRLHPDMPASDRALLDTQLHARLAAPWTCLVAVLMAIPFAAPSGRRNVFVGVSCSILICFLYFLAQQFAMGLGTTGKIPPLAAAWSANVAFSLAGIILISRVR